MCEIGVVLLLYNRTKCLDHLLERMNDHTWLDVHVFIDGARTQDDIRIQSIIKSKLRLHPNFKIHLSESNVGLKASVQRAVQFISSLYSKFIVLEDDLILSTSFFPFLRETLIKYESDKSLAAISGFTYNIPILNKFNVLYSWPINSSWGWASWSSRWQNFSWDLNVELKEFQSTGRRLKEINGWVGREYENQLGDNLRGKKSTWVIIRQIFIVRTGMRVLHPSKSLVKNVGGGLDSTNSKYALARGSIKDFDYCDVQEVNSQLLYYWIKLFFFLKFSLFTKVINRFIYYVLYCSSTLSKMYRKGYKSIERNSETIS